MKIEIGDVVAERVQCLMSHRDGTPGYEIIEALSEIGPDEAVKLWIENPGDTLNKLRCRVYNNIRNAQKSGWMSDRVIRIWKNVTGGYLVISWKPNTGPTEAPGDDFDL